MKITFRYAAGLFALLLTVFISSSIAAANKAFIDVPCRTTNSTIALTITGGTVKYGTLPLNTTEDTTIGQTQNVTNSSDSETVDFKIKSGDAIHTAEGGVDWTLGVSPGINQFTHEFKTSGPDWTELPSSDSSVDLASGVAKSDSVNFDLRIGMPTEITDYREHTITVTITAVAP
jgi:hypothetical protein